MKPEDDDAEHGGGPPPDPSMRAWRHPSEVAAANAAAQRPIAPSRHRWSLPSFGAGVLLGVVGAVGLLAVTTEMFDVDQGNRVEFRSADDGPSSNDDTPGHDSNSSEPDGENQDRNAASAPDRLDSDERPDGDRITNLVDHDTASSDDGSSGNTSTTVDKNTINGVQVSTSSLPIEGDGSGPNDDAELDIVGVVGLYHLDGVTPVATAFAVDGMLFTSASALQGTERLVVHEGPASFEVQLQGIDRFTDLAVLVPVVVEGVAVDLPNIEVNEEPQKVTRSIRLVASDGRPELIFVGGRLIATGGKAITRDGHAVINALYTTARLPNLGGGAPLVDDDGRALGMVIDSNDYLAIAVPIEDVRRIGRSIMETGWAHPNWIGIEGQASDEGIVVTEVAPGGPAADAGLQADDLILNANGEPALHMADLISWLRSMPAGEGLELTIRTDHAEWSAVVTIGERQP